MKPLGKKGLLHNTLCQYVFKLLLCTLIALYSNQYQLIIALLGRLIFFLISTVINALEFRQLLIIAMQQMEFLIAFIDSHQYISGFQISAADFEKIGPKALIYLDEYIEYKKKQKIKIKTLKIKRLLTWKLILSNLLSSKEEFPLRI